MKEEKVSIVVSNFNGADTLPETLASFRKLDYPIDRVVLVDDGSTDDSLQTARRMFPEVDVVRMERNTGNLNLVRNTGLKRTRTPLAFVTDNDVVLDSRCIRTLVEAHRKLPGAGICTPRLYYAGERDRIYADGQRLHYLCTTIAETRDQKRSGSVPAWEGTAGGGILLLDKTKFNGHGFFDNDYSRGWGDDGSLYRSLALKGVKCYHVPDAVAYHHPKQRTTERAFLQVRNRGFLILETYALKTLILITPALFLYEIFLFLLLCLKGAAGAYVRGNWAVICRFPGVLAKRRVVQRMRTVSDRQTMTSGSIYVSRALLDNRALKWGLHILNGCFNGYWKLVKRWV